MARTRRPRLPQMPPQQPPAAYPKLIVQDDRPTGEPAQSPAFHERNLSHLIGRRTTNGVWPDDPSDAETVARFQDGQKALYEDKDSVAAIRAYEAALDRDPTYLKAWVALAIAYVSDNTETSLEQAEGVLERLAALAPSDWLTPEASSIIHQNLAYLHVHRYRSDSDRDVLACARHLRAADDNYRIAEARNGGRDRIEYLCPWAYVKLELGDADDARGLWERARTYAAANGASGLLAEYAAKYAPLRRFFAGEGTP